MNPAEQAVLVGALAGCSGYVLEFLVCRIACSGELPERHFIACMRWVVVCAGFVIGSTRNPQIPVFYQRTIARDASSQWDFRRDIPQVPHRPCILLRCHTCWIQSEGPGEKVWP